MSGDSDLQNLHYFIPQDTQNSSPSMKLSFLCIAGHHASLPQSHSPNIDWNNSPQLPLCYFHLEVFDAL